MDKKHILSCIKEFPGRIFTTRQLSNMSGKSLSATIQALTSLKEKGMVEKLYRGIWAEDTGSPLSPYSVIPFLPLKSRAYVSFISALHFYDIIEQIPQVITLASIEHTRKIATKVGTFSVHRIKPEFFKGFKWYKNEGKFLIAEKEKALVDCLYISAYKKNRFGYFPELSFDKSFKKTKVKYWIKQIPENNVRKHVQKKVKEILEPDF